jgi:signal peptidase
MAVQKMAQKKKIKKWIGNITTGLLILVFLMVATFVVSSKMSGGAPKVFGYELLNVLSGSMEPTIKTGSIIAIQPDRDFTKLQEGNIITYRSVDDPNVLITHRILEVQNVGDSFQYVTMGDNNDGKDPVAIPASNVVGLYSGFTIPLLGYVFAFVKSKAGIVSLIIIPGALLILWQMVSVWRMISKLDEDKRPTSSNKVEETYEKV